MYPAGHRQNTWVTEFVKSTHGQRESGDTRMPWIKSLTYTAWNRARHRWQGNNQKDCGVIMLQKDRCMDNWRHMICISEFDPLNTSQLWKGGKQLILTRQISKRWSLILFAKVSNIHQYDAPTYYLSNTSTIISHGGVSHTNVLLSHSLATKSNKIIPYREPTQTNVCSHIASQQT